MKYQIQNIIFAVLKVVRDGDLEQAIPLKHNNLKAYRVQASRPVCLLLRFFYCAVVFLVQPSGIRSRYPKTSVGNPPFRGRQRVCSNVGLLTHDLHAKVNTTERTKIVGMLRDYCSRVAKLMNERFLFHLRLTAKTLHEGKECPCFTL